VPHRTRVDPRGTGLPARLVSSFFIVESQGDDGRNYRYLIDTGSSATLVTADLARRFALKPKSHAAPARVRVRSAHGGELELAQVTLRRLALGSTTFEGCRPWCTTSPTFPTSSDCRSTASSASRCFATRC